MGGVAGGHGDHESTECGPSDLDCQPLPRRQLYRSRKRRYQFQGLG